MSAESIVGQIDNCLFSLHRPQSIGRTTFEEESAELSKWSRMSRFRIDGVPIDHMQSSTDTGVMSWVTSGRLDLVADIRFPREDTKDLDLSRLVGDLVDDITDRFSNSGNGGKGGEERIPGRVSLSRDALKVPVESEGSTTSEKEKLERRKALRFAKAVKTSRDEEEIMRKMNEEPDNEGEEEEEDKIVSIELDLRFKDLKAHVPVRFPPDQFSFIILNRLTEKLVPSRIVFHFKPILRQQRVDSTHRSIHQQ